MSFPLVTADIKSGSNQFIKITLPKKTKKLTRNSSNAKSTLAQKIETLYFTLKNATFVYTGWTIEGQAYGIGSYTKTHKGMALAIPGFFNGLEILPCRTYIQISYLNGYTSWTPIAITKTILITEVFKSYGKRVLQ